MKIIITDMDGTLLNHQKEMDPGFKPLITKMHQKGYLIGVASGRQYEILKRDFMEYHKDMVFIADNGALTYVDGKMVDIHPIDKDMIRKICHELDKDERLAYILCGPNVSYLHTDNDKVFKMAKMYCHNLKDYQSLEDILDKDQFVKIAVYDLDENCINKVSCYDNFKEQMNVVVSAKDWIDFNVKGVNKGTALKVLKDLYHLKDEDCIIFGDYNNDIEILKEAYYSYAMANATKEVKAVANFETLSCDEHGVSKTINQLLKEGII